MAKRGVAVVMMVVLLLCSACGGGQDTIYDEAAGNAGGVKEDAGELKDEGNGDSAEGGSGQQSDPAEEDGKGDSAPKLSGTLTVKANSSFFVNIMANEFMEAYPKVKVVIESEDGKINNSEELCEYAETLAVELMSGDTADVVEVSSVDISKTGKNGLLCDLYKFMEGDATFHKEDYFTNIFEAIEVDGELYGIPMGFSSRMVWVNRKITDALGMDMGEYKTINAEQMLDIYEQAKELPELPEDFAFSKHGPIYNLSLEVNNYFDWKERTASYDTPECIRFLERLRAAEDPDEPREQGGMIYSDNRFPERDGDLFSMDQVEGRHMGKLGMESELWNRPIPFVLTTGRQGTICFPLAITSGSQNQELAWEFLKFCIKERDPADYGKSGQDVWYQDLFGDEVPINRNNCRHYAEYVSSWNLDEELYAQYIEIVESCDQYEAYIPDVNRALNEMLDDYLRNGVIGVEEAVGQMQERVEAYLKE